MTFSVEPINSAVALGIRTIMTCAIISGPGSQLSWRFQKDGERSTSTIVDRCTALDGAKYELDHIAENHCDLVIKSPNFDYGGIYTCFATDRGREESASAGLVVLDPVCNQNITSGDEGEIAGYTCTIQFTGDLAPTVNQEALPGPFGKTDSKLEVNERKRVEKIRIPIHKPFIRPVNITVVFDKTYPGVKATNVPAYKFSWSSEPVMMNFGPEEVTITTSSGGQNIHDGDEVICSAKGFPEPTYTLKYGDEKATQGSRAKIVLTAEEKKNEEAAALRSYTCTALNSYGSKEAHLALSIYPSGDSRILPSTFTVMLTAILVLISQLIISN